MAVRDVTQQSSGIRVETQSYCQNVQYIHFFKKGMQEILSNEGIFIQ